MLQPQVCKNSSYILASIVGTRDAEVDVQCDMIVVFICPILLVNNAEYLLKLLVTFIYLFLFDFEHSLYILDTSSLLDMWFAKTFPQYSNALFVNDSVHKQKCVAKTLLLFVNATSGDKCHLSHLLHGNRKVGLFPTVTVQIRFMNRAAGVFALCEQNHLIWDKWSL